MELLLKASAALLLSALVGLLLRKNAPELGLLLSMAAVTAVFAAACGFLEPFRELIQTTGKLLGEEEPLLRPVVKCLAVALVTRFAGDLCRDASQTAAASALEFAGTVCAFAVAAPLLLSVVKSLGGLL